MNFASMLYLLFHRNIDLVLFLAINGRITSNHTDRITNPVSSNDQQSQLIEPTIDNEYFIFIFFLTGKKTFDISV